MLSESIIASIYYSEKPCMIVWIVQKIKLLRNYGEYICEVCIVNKNNIIYKSIRSVYYVIKNLPSNTKLAIDTYSIKRFRNIHKGETCFVVGNGPSMTMEDLDTIHRLGIKSFACNKVYLAFDNTKWRPDYFFVSDSKIISEIDYEKTGLNKRNMFFPRKFKKEIGFGNYYESLCHDWLNHGDFSTDAHKGVYQCETIIAEAIQLAYYMGFTKVYIIGVDFSYNMQSVDKKSKTFKNGENNYFIKDYASEGQVLNLPNQQANILGFKAARDAFESNGREIYNATRGGKLEVFIRKDLDEVFKEIEDSKNENSSICSNKNE